MDVAKICRKSAYQALLKAEKELMLERTQAFSDEHELGMNIYDQCKERIPVFQTRAVIKHDPDKIYQRTL